MMVKGFGVIMRKNTVLWGGRYLDLLEGWYWKNKVFLVRSGFKLGLGLLVGNVAQATSLLASDRVKIQTLGICYQSV